MRECVRVFLERVEEALENVQEADAHIRHGVAEVAVVDGWSVNDFDETGVLTIAIGPLGQSGHDDGRTAQSLDSKAA